MNRKQAIQILFNNSPADYIVQEFETPEFFEFHVSAGGDALVYRIYKKDGSIYNK